MRFDPFDEYLQYLKGVSFLTLAGNDAFIAASKRVHRRVLGLLVLEFQTSIGLEKALVGSLDRDAAPFLAEFRSDVLGALVIFELGLYKAASMSARSALENFFRVLAARQGLDFRPLDSVADLIALIKQSPMRKTYTQFDQQLGALIGKYGDLCKYVHSAGEEFLTLDRKLNEIPRWTEDSGESFAKSFVQLIQASISLLIYLDTHALRELRHDQRDVVLDSLPAHVKAGLVKDLGLF